MDYTVCLNELFTSVGLLDLLVSNSNGLLECWIVGPVGKLDLLESSLTNVSVFLLVMPVLAVKVRYLLHVEV